jgi:hypothetical protein
MERAVKSSCLVRRRRTVSARFHGISACTADSSINIQLKSHSKWRSDIVHDAPMLTAQLGLQSNKARFVFGSLNGASIRQRVSVMLDVAAILLLAGAPSARPTANVVCPDSVVC